jgi:hypothetical protein
MAGISGVNYFGPKALLEDNRLSRTLAMRSTILLIAILLLAPCHGGTSPVSTQNNSTQDKLYISHQCCPKKVLAV